MQNEYLYDVCLFRLGLAERSDCEAALQRANWNVELAASAILDTR